MTSLRQRLNEYEPACVQNLGQPIEEWKDARGARVAGYIDFTSGLLTANIGHDNRYVARAVAKARGWSAWYSPTEARLEAYEALDRVLPGYKYLLLNSGSEAIDCAMKIAQDNGYTCASIEGSYHGSTIGAAQLMASRQKRGQRTAIFLESFIGYNCRFWEHEEIWGFKGQQRKANLVVFDEMQAGFGRTGKWWGFQNYVIEPDIVVGGKAAGGGFPVAFVACRPDLADWNPKADYISTFSANSMACKALAATVKYIINEGLVLRARNIGLAIAEQLEEWKDSGLIESYQGRGCAWAIPHEDTAGVASLCRSLGLLIIDTMRGYVKLSPPLVICDHDLKCGLSMLRKALENS